MVATTARPGRQGTSASWFDVLSLQLGFSWKHTPLVVLVGLLFVVATLPELFAVIARIDVEWSPGRAVLDFMNTFANTTLKPPLESPAVGEVERYATMAAFWSVPALLVASLVCSAKVGSGKPFGVSALALSLGLVALPVLTWGAEIVVGLLRLGFWFHRMIVRFIDWISTFLAVVGILLLVGLAIAALYWVVRRIHRARRWVTASLVLVTVAAVLASVAFGMFDEVFAWLRTVVGELAAGISRYLGPVVAATVLVLLVVMAGLAVVGAIVALFGHVGRTIVLPFKAAGGAGSDQGRCADTAAGMGVALSMLLAAAVTNDGYRVEFGSIWSQTPVIGSLPNPVGLYDLLLRDPAVAFLAPGFAGFNPTVDVVLTVLIGVIAVGALLFNRRVWAVGNRPGIASPVMVTVGLAIALAIPLLILTIVMKRLAADD